MYKKIAMLPIVLSSHMKIRHFEPSNNPATAKQTSVKLARQRPSSKEMNETAGVIARERSH
jgi:hypothetical protein